MNKIVGATFCVVTLIVTFAVAWVLFPHAALSEEQYSHSVIPQEPELFDDIAIRDFGEVSVLDMVLHYIEDPPAEADGKENKVRFQGC